jgi:Fic family protein
LLEWTYHSNAIEGNTLTLRKTKVVLEGITVGGKTLREHVDVTSHRDAILYVEDLVARREALTECRSRIFTPWCSKVSMTWRPAGIGAKTW